jgi:hypothetical protein
MSADCARYNGGRTGSGSSPSTGGHARSIRDHLDHEYEIGGSKTRGSNRSECAVRQKDRDGNYEDYEAALI